MANKENGPFLFFSKIYYTAVLKKKKLDFIFNFFFKTHAIISMLKFRSSWICVRNVMCVCDSYTFILGSVIKFHQPIPFKSVVITCIHSRVSVYSLNFRISIIDIRNCRLEARAHGRHGNRWRRRNVFFIHLIRVIIIECVCNNV